MLYIGNQTSCWTASPTEPFEFALAQQFNAFEWFPDKKPEGGWDESDLDGGTRASIRERAGSQGVRLSVHARWQANPFASDGNALLLKDLALARDLDARLLNIHLFHERGFEAFIQAILPLVRATQEAGLQLSIENTPFHSPEHFNDFFSQLQSLRSEVTGHVGMCLDLGHANLCSATRNDYLQFCDRLAPHVPIVHLHLHENWGDTDSHLPLFTGPALRDDSGIRGLIARLHRRGFSGSAILEQWPKPPSLLKQARDGLLQIWEGQGNGAQEKKDAISGEVQTESQEASPTGSFADQLVKGNRRARSWREKLDLVLGLLGDEHNVLTSEQFVDVAVYLRFLGTGEIPCSEDGRHFRPASHARIAEQIQQRLERATTPENEFLIRKIYPYLPASAQIFQRPEPLTRIRDIAHRNDISSELKREIKTTLQNKLHRCAGPEDLVVASALLERITAPGADYSSDFVQQFKIFHEELKEFFNAQSLEQRLNTLKASVELEMRDLIDRFLALKAGKSVADQLSSLEVLTSLRERFLRLAKAKPGPVAQELILADIALEDFAFVLLSEIINGSAEIDAKNMESERQALVLALTNIGLGGIEREESAALEHELRQWGQLANPPIRDDLLRLKACVLRCRRLAETFGETIIRLFSKRVESIGPALGVADHAIRVYAESDLRSHIIFQAAKLVSSLLQKIRQELGADPWDVLVAGRAFGRVTHGESLEQLTKADKETEILLLERSTGDEEIPPNVAAIALGHELPHLSHLGVRARQAGVVFVTCEEASEFSKLRRFEGKVMGLAAAPDGVKWEQAPAIIKPAASSRARSLQIPEVRLSAEECWLPIERAVPENSGGKAAGMRRLAELSQRVGAEFRTPASFVVPFGVMESALNSAPNLEAEYQELTRRLNSSSREEIGSAARRLRELVQGLSVPEAVLREVPRRFASSTSLIVRSSSNCEDLEELAGAGLYDSEINVPLAEVGLAIIRVWSSLWSERAALSRQTAKIPHERAHMAVLIQELIDPDLSFILHTVHPISLDSGEICAELVVGLGETLASAATRGTPYRLGCGKDSGRVAMEAFANFSRAARPGSRGSVRWETVDYSRIEFSREAAVREKLCGRLVAVGSAVERVFGNPQDIEGAVKGDQIFLFQARPQQGLSARNNP